jgi:filamentous hemagglutinin family protein
VGRIEGNNLFHSFSQFNVLENESATFTGPSSIANIISRVTGNSGSTINGTIDSITWMGSANFFLLNPHGILIGPTATLAVGGTFHASAADYLRFDDSKIYYAKSNTLSLSAADPAAFGFLPGASGVVRVEGSEVTLPDGAGMALTAPRIEIADSILTAPAGRIQLQSGVSGEVPVLASASTIAAGGQIQISRSTLDASGDPSSAIVIRGGRIEVLEGSYVSVDTGAEAGPHTLSVGASESLTLAQSELFVAASSFVTGGSAGAIAVDAPHIDISESAVGAVASGSSTEQGTGISLHATGPVSLTLSQITSNALTAGSIGGAVEIHAESLDLADSSSIASLSRGRGGAVSVEVEQLSVRGGSLISTSSSSGAFAGALAVTADVAIITDQRSALSTNPVKGGGEITARFGSLTLTGGALIRTGSFAAGNTGGAISLIADHEIMISGGAGISSQAYTQPVGSVFISADTLQVDNGFISSSTVDAGTGGSIGLVVGTLTVSNGGQIASSSISPATGRGGDIRVTASRAVRIGGTSPSGESPIPELFRPTPSVAASGIFTTTSGLGDAGAIVINTATVDLNTGGRIDSGTTGAGRGGATDIHASESIAIQQNAVISSATTGTGPGGDIEISAPTIQLLSGGSISASSTGTDTAVAGNINITFGDTLRVNGAAITTQSDRAPGGNINIVSTGSILEVINGLISTSVQSGAGGGGNITIGSSTHPIGTVLLSNAQILASAIGGPGGNITVFADTFLAGDSLVDASSKENINGTVNINARITDLSGSLSELPADTLQAAELLTSRCRARTIEGKASSLVVGGRDAMPPQPGGLLVSPLGVPDTNLALVPGPDETLFPVLTDPWLVADCGR